MTGVRLVSRTRPNLNGMSRALAKRIAHMGHLQEGLHVRYLELPARCILDASDMQVPKWTRALACRMHFGCTLLAAPQTSHAGLLGASHPLGKCPAHPRMIVCNSCCCVSRILETVIETVSVIIDIRPTVAKRCCVQCHRVRKSGAPKLRVCVRVVFGFVANPCYCHCNRKYDLAQTHGCPQTEVV